jgi:hypothetical protein
MCIVQAVGKAPIKSLTRRSKWRFRARLSSVEKGARATKSYGASLAGCFTADHDVANIAERYVLLTPAEDDTAYE